CLALEVFGLADPGDGADVNRCMAKRSRGKHGNGNVRALIIGQFHDGRAHRKFANIEVPASESAKEDFFWREAQEHWVDAVNCYLAIDQWTRPIVITDGNRQPQISHVFLLIRLLHS